MGRSGRVQPPRVANVEGEELDTDTFDVGAIQKRCKGETLHSHTSNFHEEPSTNPVAVKNRTMEKILAAVYIILTLTT